MLNEWEPPQKMAMEVAMLESIQGYGGGNSRKKLI